MISVQLCSYWPLMPMIVFSHRWYIVRKLIDTKGAIRRALDVHFKINKLGDGLFCQTICVLFLGEYGLRRNSCLFSILQARETDASKWSSNFGLSYLYLCKGEEPWEQVGGVRGSLRLEKISFLLNLSTCPTNLLPPSNFLLCFRTWLLRKG